MTEVIIIVPASGKSSFRWVPQAREGCREALAEGRFVLTGWPEIGSLPGWYPPSPCA